MNQCLNVRTVPLPVGIDLDLVRAIPAPAETESMARPPVPLKVAETNGVTSYVFRVSDSFARRRGVLPFVVLSVVSARLSLGLGSEDGESQIVVQFDDPDLAVAAHLFPGHAMMRLFEKLDASKAPAVGGAA